MANELRCKYPESAIAGYDEVDALTVFTMGMAGDDLCREVFRRGDIFGIALAGLINVLNPEVIVIGGGAADGWELFIGHLRSMK